MGLSWPVIVAAVNHLSGAIAIPGPTVRSTLLDEALPAGVHDLPLGSLLFRVAAMRQRLFRERVGLSPAAFRCLGLVERADGLPQAEIEQRFDADAAMVTRLAKQLEQRGLIRRLPKPGDARAVLVYLTADGRDFMARMRPVVDGLNREIFSGVAEADLETCWRVLRAVRGNLRAMTRRA